MKKRLAQAGLILLLVAFVAGTVCAETANITPANKNAGKPGIASTAAKEKGPGMKIERGMKNILFGWTEIPKSIVQVTKDSKNPIWGLTGGTLQGLGKAFPRTISGAADVVSFPMGDYKKMPVKPDELNTQIK